MAATKEPKTLIDLSFRLTEEKAIVACTFPGGDFKLTVPPEHVMSLFTTVGPQIQQALSSLNGGDK